VASMLSMLLYHRGAAPNMGMIILSLVAVPVAIGVIVLFFMIGEQPSKDPDRRGGRVSSRPSISGVPPEVAPYSGSSPPPGSLGPTTSDSLRYPVTTSAPPQRRRQPVQAQPGGLQSTLEQPLCSALIVHQPGGVTLQVNGLLAPYQQEEVLAVSHLESTSVDEVIVRVFISESGRDSGILMESAMRFPIAFLDTEKAVQPKGASPAPPSTRKVSISRAAPVSWDPCATPFAVVKAEEPSHFVVRRGTADGSPGKELLSVVSDESGSQSNVLDENHRLIAAMETRTDPTGRPFYLVHIDQGVDAGLVLSGVISAVKLQ